MCRLLQRSRDCSKESGAVWAYAQAAFEKNFYFFVTFRERKSIYYKGVIKWTSI